MKGEKIMDMNNYMDYAKAHGYDIQYTGIGMAYLSIGQVKAILGCTIQNIV